MSGAGSIFFGAIFTAGVAFALGALLLQRVQVKLYRGEAAALGFVCGSACLSLLVFLLCVAHLARAGVFLAIGALAAAAAVWGARHNPPREIMPASAGLFRLILPVVFAAFSLLYLANAMAPEISPDGSGYHLGNVVRLWRHHGFDWEYHSIYSYLSQGMEMLFLVAFSFGGHSSAALVHAAFLIALPLLAVCFGRRIGFPRAGEFAGLILFVSPLIGKVGVSAYNDVAVAAVVLALFYFIEIWRETKHASCWIAIGLLAGFAYALKYTAGLAIPFALVAGRPRTARQAMLFAVSAGVMVCPWLLRNWLWVDNPTAPFFNDWFPNAFFYPGPEQEYRTGLSQLPEGIRWWEVPLDVTLFGSQIPGFIGPLFLLAPIGLLAARFAVGRRLLLAAAVFAVPVYFNVGTRFLMPALPFVALAIGIALRGSAIGLPVLAGAQAVLCWPWVTEKYSAPWAWRIREIPIQAALRKEPEAAYLARNLEEYGLKQLVEGAVGISERVFSFAGRPEAYIDRHIIVSFESALGLRARNTLWVPIHFPPVRHARLRFPPVLSKSVRISHGKAAGSYWTASEIRILYGGEAIRTTSVDARPNRWEAGLAFDGNTATAWSTWQPRSPADVIQANFEAELIDEVIVESAAETGADLTIEVLHADGRRAAIKEPVEESRVEPRAGLRMAASRGVLSMGIRFLLINPDDLIAEDLKGNTSEWGLALAGEANGVRLYRIER